MNTDAQSSLPCTKALQAENAQRREAEEDLHHALSDVRTGARVTLQFNTEPKD